MRQNVEYNPTVHDIIDQNINLQNKIVRVNNRTSSCIPPPEKPVCANNFKILNQARQSEIDRQNEHLVRKLHSIQHSASNQHSKATMTKLDSLTQQRKKIAETNKRYKEKQLENANAKLLSRLVQKKSTVKKILDRPIYKKLNIDNRTLITDISKVPFKFRQGQGHDIGEDKQGMKLLHEDFGQDSGAAMLFQFYQDDNKVKAYIYKYSNEVDYATKCVEYDQQACMLNRGPTIRPMRSRLQACLRVFQKAKFSEATGSFKQHSI